MSKSRTNRISITNLFYFILKKNIFFHRSSNTIPADILNEYESLHRLSTVYYAYNAIHSYLTEPFTSSSPLTLFNTSRYVANQISISGSLPPSGISML